MLKLAILLQDCPAALVFNADTNRCDVASNVVGRFGPFVCPNADGYYGNPLSCISYFLCIDSDPILVV